MARTWEKLAEIGTGSARSAASGSLDRDGAKSLGPAGFASVVSAAERWVRELVWVVATGGSEVSLRGEVALRVIPLTLQEPFRSPPDRGSSIKPDKSLGLGQCRLFGQPLGTT